MSNWQGNNCYLCDTELRTRDSFQIDISLLAKYTPKLVKRNVQRAYACKNCSIHFGQYHVRRSKWDKNVNHLKSLKNSGLTATLNHFSNSTPPICNLCHNRTALSNIIPVNQLEVDVKKMVGFFSEIGDLQILNREPVICAECFDVIETFNSFYHMCLNCQVKFSQENGNKGLTQPQVDKLVLGSDTLLNFDVDFSRDTSELINRADHPLPVQTPASLSQKKIRTDVVNPLEIVYCSPIVKATPVTLIPFSPDAIIGNLIGTVSKHNETPNMKFEKLNCKSISDKHPKINDLLLTNNANRNNRTVGTDIAETVMNRRRIKRPRSETDETKDENMNEKEVWKRNTKRFIQSANGDIDIPQPTVSNTPCEDLPPVIEINMTKVSELFITGFKSVDKRTDDIISILNEKGMNNKRDELLDFQSANPVVQTAEKLSPSRINFTKNYPSTCKSFTSAFEDFLHKTTTEKRRCSPAIHKFSKLQL